MENALSPLSTVARTHHVKEVAMLVFAANRKHLKLALVLAISLFAVLGTSTNVALADQQNGWPVAAHPDWGHGHHLYVTSSTFTNGSPLPQSMILNAQASFGPPPVPGCEGSDESPQLSWYGAPRFTQSFVVLMFDIDASFTHWGMFNISGSLNSLPQNAGVKNSKYGMQVANDYGLGEQYDGPCPPAGQVHHYIITVYALDTYLNLSKPYGFIPDGESLLYALVQMRSHILDSGSISGTYFIPTSG
jgi:Raf kinase inhibitor-like YbhB/YbcL family protein